VLDFVEAGGVKRRKIGIWCRTRVLTPVTVEVRSGEQAAHRLHGIWVVDEAKFNALPDDEVLKLFKSGQLAWVYAHLMSLKNLSRYQIKA